MENSNKKDNKNSRKILIIIFLIIICIILLLLFKGCNNEPDTPVIDPNAEIIEDDKSEEAESDDVAIYGISQLKISKNCTDVVLNYKNPEKNDGKFYISITLMLKDNKEVLYESGLIPPGEGIKNISLSRALDEGIYTAILHVQPYKMNDLSQTNNADLEIKLIVE